jgi:hypothetical protein
LVRLANFSYESPALQVCSKPGGAPASDYSNFTSGKFPATGLLLETVSAYLEIPPGTYDFGIVAADASDCSAPLVELNGITLADTSKTTFLASGKISSSTFSVHPFQDDSADSSAAQFRFIHAGVGAPELDLGIYSGEVQSPPDFTDWSVLFNDVIGDEGISTQTGGQVPLDSRGYCSLPVGLPGGLPFEARDSVTGTRFFTAFLPAAGLVGGDVSTAFFAINADLKPVTFLCSDVAAPVNGLSPCTKLTTLVGNTAPTAQNGLAPYASERFAHVATEQSLGSVDVCIKPFDNTPWVAGASQARLTAVPYSAISGNLSLGIDTAGYAVKVLAASASTDCSASAPNVEQEFSTGDVTALTNNTIAITGEIGHPTAGFKIRAYENNDTVASGSLVRFVHTAVGVGDATANGSIDVGVVNGVGLLGPFIYNNIAYGGVDQTAAATVGYISNTFSTNTIIGLSTNADANGELSAAPLPTAYATANAASYTYWVIGKSGNASTPPALLVCRDSETAADVALDCTKLTF